MADRSGILTARWLSVRPANTEPLLRLNVRAVGAAIMESIRDEALELMRPY